MEPRASSSDAVARAREDAQDRRSAQGAELVEEKIRARVNRFIARHKPALRRLILEGGKGEDFRALRHSRAKIRVEAARIRKLLRPEEERILYLCERRRRREQREGLWSVYEVHLDQLEGASMRCGRIDDADHGLGIPITLKRKPGPLCTKSRRSVSAVDRRLRDLHDAGWLHSRQPRELKEDGTYKGFPAVRILDDRPFELIGKAKDLKSWRKWCSDRRKEERQRRGLTRAARRDRKRRLDRLGMARRAGVDRRSGEEAAERAYTEQLGQVMQENQTREPPLSPDEMRAEARARARPPPDG